MRKIEHAIQTAEHRRARRLGDTTDSWSKDYRPERMLLWALAIASGIATLATVAVALRPWTEWAALVGFGAGFAAAAPFAVAAIVIRLLAAIADKLDALSR